MAQWLDRRPPIDSTRCVLMYLFEQFSTESSHFNVLDLIDPFLLRSDGGT